MIVEELQRDIETVYDLKPGSTYLMRVTPGVVEQHKLSEMINHFRVELNIELRIIVANPGEVEFLPQS